MGVSDPFSGYPNLQMWRHRLEDEKRRFQYALEDLKVARENATISADEFLAGVMNAHTRLYIGFADANEAIEYGFTRRDLRSAMINAWPTREIEGVELRALITSCAYSLAIRPAASGAKDSRMDAAMLVAAHWEGLDSSDPIETVRKSIHRLRVGSRDKVMFSLNRETLMVECHEAESVMLAGLPGKRGRPKKNS